jgi:hypothetical protein
VYYDTIAQHRMPKNAKKGAGKKIAAAPAQADEAFDDMLAELCAADLIATPVTEVSISSSSSSSSSSIAKSGPNNGVPSNAAHSSASRIQADATEPTEGEVSIDILVQACIRGDMTQLRRWARGGIRVSSAEPLCQAAAHGKLDVVRYLVSDLGADVNQADDQGYTPLFVAAQKGHLAVVRCFIKELGADVNKATKGGATPLFMAAQDGLLAIVQCLVKELGADVNLTRKDGATVLMVAAHEKHHRMVAYLMRHGADPQATAPRFGTAANVSKTDGASAEQTAYLEAKTHCSNPGCSGAGIKKCTGCKQVRYCGQQCQLAHWQVHKADCKATAELRGAKNK